MSASAGRVLIIPKGAYNSGTAYEKLDSVFFNGSSYICIKDSLGHAPTDSEYWQIFAQGAGVIAGAFVGACDSLGSAQVKSVIIPQADNFALQKGVIVGVRFTNTNTFEATSENSIALNVNSTGAIPIYFGGTATPLGSNIVAFGEAGYTHFYQYDGTNWVFIGRSGVQTAEQTPYDSTKSTKTAIDEAQALADTNKANIEAIVNVYGSKQLIPYPFAETTKTENGLTFTDNGDGTVTVNGTATAQTFFIFNRTLTLKKGTYILNGCPSGGAETSYLLYCYNSGIGNLKDTGSGVLITCNADTTCEIGIRITYGTVISTPITFEPMIRDARISDGTFAPYAKTNRELTKDIAKSDLGIDVNLLSYNSSGNKYKFPQDGYLVIFCAGVNKLVKAVIQGSASNSFSFCVASLDNDYYYSNAIFVKKGMQVYLNASETTATNFGILFKPLQ